MIASPAPANRRLTMACLGTLIVLMAQFLLGMAVNLYIAIPDADPAVQRSGYWSDSLQSTMWALNSGHWLLTAHIVIGILLLGTVIVAAGYAFSTRGLALRTWSIVGTLSVVAAAFNGVSYLDYHTDISSMLMAAAFALAVLAYSAMLFIAARR